ncbi:mitosis initiation protein fs(1)Ya [Drosophila tropicalis]|uniref:mitosis initiation protein fs(1)Ya n=1 Tax=Drosophila tropicalis TaxID=46794 RepID=UPI0035AC26B8
MSILNLNSFYTRLPNEAKCHICKRIFCCGKCRQKHEFANHAIAVSEPRNNDMSNPQDQGSKRTIYVFCPICERKPLVLRDEAIYSELLQHIENEHLPLRCRKCLKTYTKIEDLREFSKCVDIEQNCSTSSCSTEDASKVTVTTVKKAASSTISTQTSPAMTPISLINLQWKAKSRQQQQQQPLTLQEEFMCGGDSVSSIRNLSSFSSSNFSLRRSIGQFTNPYSNPPETAKKGKVIRSTSTPLQVDYSMIPKTKETVTFNASSLYHEELPSPAVLESNPMQQHRAWKGGVSSAAVVRNKITAVTPLRQVMSKSIQKAFVEHGGIMTAASSTALVPPPGSRLRFDLSDNNNSASTSPALDLRLSPAMRRTQSEATSSTTARSSTMNDPSIASSVMRQQILMSAQKLTTESIIITRNSHDGGNGCSTVYNSCESVEIIQTTSQTAEVRHHQHHPHPPITPITRVPGAMINKKLIKFETPKKHSKDLHTDDIDEPNNRSSKEIFYTPNPDTPNDKSDSSSRRPNIIPRQLSGQFSPRDLPALEPPPLDRPRRRPPLRECQAFKTFSDISVAATTNSETIDDDEEVFLPTNASTRNDRTSSDQGIGRLWSLMSTVMRLPATREKGDKENQNPNPLPAAGSLLRRCASIAGSFVRSRAGDNDNKGDDDDGGDMQTLKRKRTQTLDSHQYGSTSTSPLSPLPGTSSKRYRIQPRRPIERMRHPT